MFTLHWHFFYGIYGCIVLLQAWVGILVAKPFRVHYVIILPSKYILIVIGSDSKMIRNQNIGCHWSATKCEMYKGNAN